MTEEISTVDDGEAEGPVEAAARRARAMLDDRVDAVREVARAHADLEEARRLVTAAERGVAASHRSAQRAGWTAGQLRQLGYPEPARRAPGRPARPAPERDVQDPGGGGPVAN